jgi:dimethylhistidine N-methyltransferase
MRSGEGFGSSYGLQQTKEERKGMGAVHRSLRPLPGATVDRSPDSHDFLTDVLDGLSRPQKQLSPKYFYDDRGARLFEDICALDEYYIPSAETEIMVTHIDEMVGLLGEDVLLIEYGCGDCAKTRLLLDRLPSPAGFVPIDISSEQLHRVASDLESSYPGLEVMPVCADYTRYYTLPWPDRSFSRKVVYFPGSTVGNFDPLPARDFLDHICDTCASDGALLIGVDLRKDPAVLHRAYNDRDGVTAAFNLNILGRINRELSADFRLDGFEHYAFFNPSASRVEMHLVSMRDQDVHIGGVTVHFGVGESIWTESSYKYSIEGFKRLVSRTGFKVERVWTDERDWFSVQYLSSRGNP